MVIFNVNSVNSCNFSFKEIFIACNISLRLVQIFITSNIIRIFVWKYGTLVPVRFKAGMSGMIKDKPRILQVKYNSNDE